MSLFVPDMVVSGVLGGGETYTGMLCGKEKELKGHRRKHMGGEGFISGTINEEGFPGGTILFRIKTTSLKERDTAINS